ncbi:hypothetical protein [Mesonia maritima]|uniref:Uncharacterized protein n=1 Tax=Mesonia maritima TaxID=1793873 RepID=A0ABU1K6J8_9FLAO|nr:hypothetical protein [Mesonia maritima]MDR6300137.1 hypothetical protein [Mesonia maritima]
MIQKCILILSLSLISCKGEAEKSKSSESQNVEIIKTPDFELSKANIQKGLLILFPCFTCNSEHTTEEFNIRDLALKNGFSVLAMNFNKHLYLTKNEKRQLANLLLSTIQKEKLATQEIYIGGFSSGGNIALLLSDYLIEIKSKIKPRGVFNVDSPVDLLGLYTTATKNIKLDYSKNFVEESRWIKKQLDKNFGNPQNGIENFKAHSPFTYKTKNITNLTHLKDLKIRFYTEPDLKWWKKYRNNNFEDLNAFYIQKLVTQLQNEWGNKNVELIETKNSGYLANGERHPHAWSIVDKNELINWMKN